MRQLTIIFLLLLLTAPMLTQAHETNALILAGVHDPSHLVRSDDQLLLYASAVEWQAYDLTTQTWAFLGDEIYGDDAPDWYDGENQFWAPSLFRVEEDFFLLYHSAVEDEDAHRAKIGFAYGDGRGREIVWSQAEDYVLRSESTATPFAIDPAVFVDDAQRVWLVYGSHGAGIVMVELDAESGFLRERPDDKTWSPDDERFITIANYGGTRYDENNVEAAYIYNHPDTGFYYLFVNWDRCCNGIASDYHMRVGRSPAPTGPFLDRDGTDMAAGGGTLFLDEAGDILGDARFVGPGHAGIYRHSDGLDYFSHHFYDAANDGEASWALWQLDWVAGWPQIDTAHRVAL